MKVSLKELMKDFEDENKQMRDTAFDLWMKRPMTRMAISMVPASENKEVLETLLQEAFAVGFDAGSNANMTLLMKHMMKDMKG